MGRELWKYDVYDTETKKFLLKDALMSNVTKLLDIPADKVITYAEKGYAYKRRYLITREPIDGNDTGSQDKSVDSEFKEQWDKYRLMAKQALKDPEAISRFYARMQKLATKEG